MSKSWTSPPHAVNLRQFFSNIYNLRLLRNFLVTSRRWSCSRYRKIFPAWKNVKYQYGQGAKCFGTNRGIFHSQACTFSDESFILSSSCNSVEPGFLIVVRFGSSLTPSPISQLYLFLCLPVYRRSSLLTGGRDRRGFGEEPSYTTARKPGPLQIVQYSLLVSFGLPIANRRCIQDRLLLYFPFFKDGWFMQNCFAYTEEIAPLSHIYNYYPTPLFSRPVH